ncbi:MAG TPA: hypothetical protein VGF06_13150 [Terriglobales bacterium]|jgi:hypothetical protein
MPNADRPYPNTAEQWQELFRGICFELRNTLMVVEGYAEVIQEQLGPAHASAHNLSELRKAAARARKVVHEISPLLYKQPPDTP